VPEPAEYRVPGLSAPVEVLVDRWGVPHLAWASCLSELLADPALATRGESFRTAAGQLYGEAAMGAALLTALGL